MPSSHFVLLIENEPAESEPLARQLVRLAIEPIRVSDLAEAIDVVKAEAYAVRAVLLPADLSSSTLHSALTDMRDHAPGLPALAYGKMPAAAQRKRLRRAGVRLALWDDYDEGMLRFQINRLLCGQTRTTPPVRGARRAPLHAPVRIVVGGREKQGLLYSLSEGGCFIETPRASMDGARLRLHFTLEQTPYEVEGCVVFANVPGNLQRPNLPLGMGIRFEGLAKSLVRLIRAFVEQRLSALVV